jgi:3-phosphoshikimate 1-carboxyvinyltransferase
MKTITISKPDKVLRGSLQLPYSKSISNRLLIIRSLTEGDFNISHLSEADDTILLDNLLREIRTKKADHRLTELDTGNAGTAMRFLTAYLATMPGKWVLTGSERMRQRPVGALVEALKSLGAQIEYLAKLGYPPLLISGKHLKGGTIDIDAGISSQFISALMMIAPAFSDGLRIRMLGSPVSGSYLNMTARLLNFFGIDVKKDGGVIAIPPSPYVPADYSVEADWSSAAFWYEAAVFAEDVDLQLDGLEKNSLQGDSIIDAIYQNFGIITEYTGAGIRITRSRKKIAGFYYDFSDFPDIAPAVITTCAMLGIRGRFEGLKSLRIKESNRLLALKNEFEKLGIYVETGISGNENPAMEFSPSKIKLSPDHRIGTYGDHRMAMTFAPLALKFGSLTIEDPDVVKKSYPQYWEHLSALGFELQHAGKAR